MEKPIDIIEQPIDIIVKKKRGPKPKLKRQLMREL